MIKRLELLTYLQQKPKTVWRTKIINVNKSLIGKNKVIIGNLLIVSSGKTRGNKHKLKYRQFSLNIRESFLL